MEVITIESRAFKDLVSKINMISNFIMHQEQIKQQTNPEEAWVDSHDVCSFLKISKRTLQLMYIYQCFRQLSSSLRRIGNDLETTEIHYSALYFIDSNNSFRKSNDIFRNNKIFYHYCPTKNN